MPLFLIIFIAIPLLEIFLFIQVGGAIGVWSTLFLVVGTAVLGINMLRRQGLRTLRNAQLRMEQDEIPAYELLEGLLLLIAAIVLITPGFFTDAVGFALLMSRFRYWLIVQFGRAIYSRFQVYSSARRSNDASSSRRRRVTIDVDAD